MSDLQVSEGSRAKGLLVMMGRRGIRECCSIGFDWDWSRVHEINLERKELPTGAIDGGFFTISSSLFCPY